MWEGYRKAPGWDCAGVAVMWHFAVSKLDNELPVTEAARAQRRDQKRVTGMVVDGGNLRRQLKALQARAEKKRERHFLDGPRR